ncbi:hypothetical protein CVT26_003560 [Gymnopilus dilepis]|uniref:Uncharacterized protein n=1 Tax=Gymnopilus dilepis TaxID=231916 RepID=A0A409VS25_9AGAR|nr:hypothetical protein CVT26_003560 [Gymnopilus dilepis]
MPTYYCLCANAYANVRKLTLLVRKAFSFPVQLGSGVMDTSSNSVTLRQTGPPTIFRPAVGAPKLKTDWTMRVIRSRYYSYPPPSFNTVDLSYSLQEKAAGPWSNPTTASKIVLHLTDPESTPPAIGASIGLAYTSDCLRPNKANLTRTILSDLRKFIQYHGAASASFVMPELSNIIKVSRDLTKLLDGGEAAPPNPTQQMWISRSQLPRVLNIYRIGYDPDQARLAGETSSMKAPTLPSEPHSKLCYGGVLMITRIEKEDHEKRCWS